jgi:SnoaL-like domain
MSSKEPDPRINALERRIAAMEDVLAIYRMVASYGPAVDSNTLRVATDLWAEDGVYDIEVGTWNGDGELLDLFESDVHQDLLRAGCSHQVSFPRVSVRGDTAVVTCYQQLVRHENGRFEVRRQSANRWELARTPGGWRIARRYSRKIDGGNAAREILAADLASDAGIHRP